jgi:TonB-linked SusC/RagA family outer membrane protein
MRKLLMFLLAVLCIAGQADAQSRTVTGKVTSSDDGQPVIGATVIVKGTSNGTVTNAEGIYTLQVPENATTIVVRSVGMKDQEVKITGPKHNVTLYPDVTKLTETVVTANSIRRDKSSIGYAAPTLTSADLVKGQSPSPINALAGKVAGVNITTTANAPGSSSRIVLRGGSSITGNNQALLVLDGVPIDNSSIVGGGNNSNTGAFASADTRSSVDFGNRGNDINPDDIESITVLKGAAAAALYGSRASNGALIITTKTGKSAKGKNEVTFNSATTLSRVAKLPDLQNEYGQGYFDGNSEVIDPRENGSWGPKFDGVVRPWGQSINGKQLEKPYSAQPNNVRNFFKTGVGVDNNLSLSGASDKASYYLSLNDVNANGVFPGDYDKFNKYGIRFNGTAKLANNITTSVNFNYNKIHSQLIQGGQGDGSVFDAVLQTARDIPLDKMSNLNNPYYSFGMTQPDGSQTYGYYGAYTTSPYFTLKNYKNLNDVDRVTGNFSLNYKPLQWLDVTERIGADMYSDRRYFEYPKYDYFPADDAGDTLNWYAGQDHLSLGKYETDQYNLVELTHDLIVTAKAKVKDFSGSIIVGNNIHQRQFFVSENKTNANGLIMPGLYNLSNSNGALVTNDWIEKRRLVGVYADLNLSYKDMIYLEGTARNDWSSTLPVQNNSFFYPSVNGSFVFTELLKNTGFNRILNYGKLRAAWARVGNDANPYYLLTYYSKPSISSGFGTITFPFNGVNGFTTGGQIGNPDLKPEITTATEVGTELNFMNNRLSVDFTYYNNRSKNQILAVPLAYSTGFLTKVMNTGEVENKGIEIGVRGTPIRTSYGLNIELYGTYTKNKNTVLDVYGGAPVVLGGISGMSIVAASGKPYGEFYAQDVQHDAQGHVIVGASGFPLLTASPQYLGSYNPKWQASWGTNINYKNFSFSVLFDTKQGGKFYSRTKDILDFVGAAAETAVGGRDPKPFPNSVIDDGTGTGHYVTNTTAMLDKQNYFGSVIPAGQMIVDASYIRLREASFSYHLPKTWINRTKLGDLSVGLFGNNLFLWTAKQNQYADPDVSSSGANNDQGFDFTAAPSLRNFGFNVRVTF